MFQATVSLPLWYTAVTAVPMLFASGVYVYVRSTLIERIDDTLNHSGSSRAIACEQILGHWSTPHVADRDNTDTVEDDHIDLVGLVLVNCCGQLYPNH